MQEGIYIVFDNYLQNRMSFEEKKNLETQFQKDIDLREKFELYKQANLFLETKFSKDTQFFKENLSQVSEKYFSNVSEKKIKKTKIIPLTSKWFAIAATIVVVVSFWIFNQSGIPKYEEYNNHQKIHLTERSSENTTLKLAEKAFNDKNFQQAIIEFEANNIESLDTEERLYYAVSLIETEQYQKSEAILLAIKEGNSIFKEDAIWYLGLMALKQKKYDESIKYLKLITDNSERFDTAQTLLNDLD
ncbi:MULTISPECIES: tetratricopeptide repeat protein [Flavobacterium]|uniref:Tetratricopeptide repeat protein n=1 Tax=Flavobacterium jumunjinense TaxID=998845 RepID=A0ABV5GLM7_9FLAO|nr:MULTISPECIES: hypothetical protein [Flavobacterium]